MEDFIVNAEPRTVQGKGASRRLRREGKVPAILYGGEGDPATLQVDEHELKHHLESEAFFSHVLVIKTEAGEERAVLKDVQRHPAKAKLLHVDFQRVVAGQEMKRNVPLHFINEDGSPADLQGGVIEHLFNEIEITVLPRNLPEYIEVDCAKLEIGGTIHLSEVKAPEGVTFTALAHDDDPSLAVAHLPRAAVETEEDEDVEGASEEEAAEDAGDDAADSDSDAESSDKD